LLSGFADYVGTGLVTLNYDVEASEDPIAIGGMGPSQLQSADDWYPPGGGAPGGDVTLTYTYSPVPEPATLTLLGSTLLGLGVVYLRRRGLKA
jgi:hypothetical protein